MKKILLPTLLLIFITAKAQFTFNFFQDFDTPLSSNSLTINIVPGPNNIWQVGAPQKTLFSSAFSQSRVIITDTLNSYPVNNVSTFSFVVLNNGQNMPSPLALQWKQKLDMDAGKDGGIVEFSTNSGNTWQNAHNNSNTYQFYGFQPGNKDTINTNEYCFSGQDAVWRDIWLCLSPAIGNLNDSILFRFTFKSDSVNTNKEGWMIDNFIAHKSVLHPMKEISQTENIVVYPNITSGMVNVEMKKRAATDMIQNIELYSSEGKRLESYGPNYTKVVLDISKYKTGVYYLHVTINNKISKHKLLYEKN
jgi:hypothetical protein